MEPRMLCFAWKTWPISWKNVTTSSCLVRASFSIVGFAKLATIAATDSGVYCLEDHNQHEGTDPGSNTRQNQRHLSPTPKTLGHLDAI